MKNLLTFTIVVFCFLLTTQNFAQLPPELTLKGDTSKQNQNSNKLYFLASESFPLETDDKKFLNEKFVDGVIIDFENESFNIPVRYRYLDDEMQMTHLNKIKAIYPSKVKQIIFKNGEKTSYFMPVQYLEKKVKSYGYFEVVSKGKIHLLRAYRKDGKNKVKTKLFYLEDGENNLATPISKKKSKVLNAFGDQKSEMAKYAAKYSINLKDCEDLTQVFNYYNSQYLK